MQFYTDEKDYRDTGNTRFRTSRCSEARNKPAVIIGYMERQVLRLDGYRTVLAGAKT
jgi:hypothetical protein